MALLGAADPALAYSSSTGGTDVRNLRPVIGVFSQETKTVTGSSTIDPEVKKELSAYRYLIPASYVTWIGQAGARVLPILLNQPDEYYAQIFERTNGILFPGGNQRIDPSDIYTEEGEILWNLAKEANDRGDYFPIWGTCLGFEELAVLEAGDGQVISLDVVAENLALPLRFTRDLGRSRLFRSFPARLVRALRTQGLAFNSHEHGLLVSEYQSNSSLNSFFRMTSYNETSKGQLFVSTIEARDYPFYGTQWHPEKNNFEWSQNEDYSNIPHTPNAILVSEATARFFISEARKSWHTFPEVQRDELIYSAPILYTGKGDWFYQQVYVFCRTDKTNCSPDQSTE
ncbi:MAG: gamma-glutamyl-gamma-aminobutyrate hydrolase family protein [Nitrospirota bacterium]|nr:MAG: gamma-glutamyl-gamma-aminobutyrate hydrolase family protein [Nitrospirota bacterium]